MESNVFIFENNKLENKIKRILYYSGDYIIPKEDTIIAVKLLMREFFKTLFNVDIMQNLIKLNSNDNKYMKVYNKNFKKYIFKLFPIESYIFYENINYQKLFKSNDLNTKTIKQCENNLKKITFNESIKERITKYKENRFKKNPNRTKNMTDDQKSYFDKCKETRLCTYNNIKVFYAFIQKYSVCDLDFIKNDKITVLLISYILNNFIKKTIQKTIDQENINIPLEKDDFNKISKMNLINLKNKIKKLIKIDSFKIENKGYNIFKGEYEIYLDSLFVNSSNFFKINLYKNDKGIQINPIINNIKKDIKDVLFKEIKMLDLINNPLLLWKNLKGIITNCFIERYILTKKIKLKLQSIIKHSSNKKLINLTEHIKRMKLNSNFFVYLKKLLKENPDLFIFKLKNLDNQDYIVNSLIKECKANIKNIFKKWFYTKYLNLNYEKNEEKNIECEGDEEDFSKSRNNRLKSIKDYF